MKSLKVFLIGIMLGVFLGSVLPVLADTDVGSYSASCSTFSGSGTTSADYAGIEVSTVAAGDYFFVAKANSSGKFSFHIKFDKQPTGTLIDYYVYDANSSATYLGGAYFYVEKSCKPASSSSSDGGAGPIAGNLLDGRINNEADHDVAAPVAIYQDAQKNVSIWAIDPTTGIGTQAVNLPWSAIDAGGVPTDGNAVLSDTTANGLHIIVSRLTTGEIQVNVTGAGLPYIVVWSPDHPESLYHLLA